MAAGEFDLPVLGMTCAACVGRVERALAASSAVARAEVNLPLSRARVTLQPGATTTITAIADVIRKAGYVVPEDALREDSGGGTGARKLAAIERAHADEAHGLLRDAVIAIAGAIPLIAIAMLHLLPPRAEVIAQLALGTLVVLGPGMRYVRAGVRAALHRSPDMNTLVGFGAGVAWLVSTVTATRWLARGGLERSVPTLYFEAGAAIVAFVMIGKLLEARARAHLTDAVKGLLALVPRTAHRRAPDGTVSDVDASALIAGDLIVVRPGERVAADGTVIEGSSALDESLLTGESLPVDKAEGAPTYAGTLNHHGALTIRVARVGAGTALAGIARAVEDAQGSKAPIARLADRAAAWFVPVVLVLAAATFGGWLVAGQGAGIALERSLAVLVIACPCALGLATPAAVAVGTGRGAVLGILYRSGGALEHASHIDLVCLDKTGTLTAGRPVLVEAALPDRALQLAASAEQASEHPLARAIVDGCQARGLALLPATAVTARPGLGLAATVDGARVLVGTADLMALDDVKGAIPTAPEGASVSYVAVDGEVAGMLVVADPIAPAAVAAVAALKALGVKVMMLSGDREAAARTVAAAAGISEVHAPLSPTLKAEAIAAARREGHRVAMVGDGINDAPALATADLGIAIGSGAQLAADAADVTLMGGIAGLPAALGLARATLRTIHRNLYAASIYNLAAIPLAAAGVLSPMMAAGAMSLSSVSVLVSSLALRRWQPQASPRAGGAG